MGCHFIHCILDFGCFQVRIYGRRNGAQNLQSSARRHGNSPPVSSPSVWDQIQLHSRNANLVGLTWRESIGIVALAFFIISFVIALNGATGVIRRCILSYTYDTLLTQEDHAPFPVLARASWGFWGSYIAIISRAILAVFWFSIQTMNGANTIRVMLGAIWPSFLTLKNDLPADAGITTNTMVAFFLFWLIQIPFLYMHPNNLRWLFMAKSVIVPVAWVAILIWAFVATDGGEIFDQKATLSGSAYSWAFLSSLTSVIGNYATLSVNQVSLVFL